MTNFSLKQLISDLPEIYQAIYGHPELSNKISRQCTDRLQKIVQVHDAIEELLGRPLRVLDLGCAQGFFSLSLAERGAIVHGVDFLDKNITVCKALAAEHPGLQASFEVARVENIINHLEADQYDIVLGLSVFHHIVHEHGAASVRELLDHVAVCAGALIVEFALRDEPLYWAPTQPLDPRSLLDGCAFVHELARHDTHLAPIPRPLYIASNRYWVLNDIAGIFETWTTEPHSLAQGTHEGTRRYYFSVDYLAKLVRFDHLRGPHNREELTREIQFLANPPSGFPAPACLTSGTNDIEGWLVFPRKPGKLLLDALRDHTEIDHLSILRAILDQLTILEETGLYHNDVRTWNVLLDNTGLARLIDYGSISPMAQDCAWPENPFLAFFIFVRELATGIVDYPAPLRTVSISPYNLPQPYRAWAASLWKHPLWEWSFKLMRDLLDTLPDIGQNEELDMPQDAWIKSIENAIQIQSQAIRHQKWVSAQAEARTTTAEAEARAALAEARTTTTKAEARAALAEARTTTTKAEARAALAEARTQKLEAEFDLTRKELHEVHQANHNHWLQLTATRKELHDMHQLEAEFNLTRKELHEVHQANHNHLLQLKATRKELHDVHQSDHHRWQLAEASQQQIQSLLNSTSWRITAPMRWIAALPRQACNRIMLLPQKAIIKLKDEINLLIAHAKLYINRRPKLKRYILAALIKYPTLQRFNKTPLPPNFTGHKHQVAKDGNAITVKQLYEFARNKDAR